MSKIIIGYQMTTDEEGKACCNIFAQEKGCPPFWARTLYGDESISAKDLARDFETRILANPDDFVRNPDTFFGKPKRDRKDKNRREDDLP